MVVADLLNRVGFQLDRGDVQEVNNAIAGIKGNAQKLLGAIGITVSIVGAVTAIKQCIALASEAEEMQNKFNVVFQGMTKEVEDWATNFADAIGRNANDIKTYLADAQNLLVGFMGQENRAAAVEMSQAMTKMAMDLASFNNIDEHVAVNAMQKAVMGETESAKILGAVLTDVTRAEAMAALGIQGKYEALDQATKMQVNYQAIVNQSKDAIDDCERSVNSYRSTMLAYQAKQKEINTLIGQFFMPVAQKGLRLLTNGLTIVRNMAQRLNDLAAAVGGAENVFLVLGITLAGVTAVMLALNKAILIDKFNNLLKPLKGLVTSLGQLKWVSGGVVLGFLLMALAIEDFFAFMQGRDSLFGRALEKAGFDVEEMREKVTGAFEKIRQVFSIIGDGIKKPLQALMQTLREVFGSIDLNILGLLGKLLGAIINGLDKALTFLTTNEKAIAFLDGFGQVLGAVLPTVLAVIVGVRTLSKVSTGLTNAGRLLTGVFGRMPSKLTIILAIIAAVIAIGILLWKNWDKIKDKAAEFKNKIAETFENMRSAVSEKVENIKTTIQEGFQTAIDWITSLPDQAFEWGRNIVLSIVNGIKSIGSGIRDAVTGAVGKVAEFFGYEGEDTGDTPPQNTGGRGRSALTGVRNGVAAMAQAGAVSGSTAATVRNNNSTSRTVNQNVNIQNTFNGDKAAQKDGAKAMDKSAKDATAQMARGLAFA